VKKIALITTFSLLIVWSVCVIKVAAQEEVNDVCFKAECWKEEGLTRLASTGCPTPTLFIKTALRELSSYVKAADALGLTDTQKAQVQKIYEHANMLVIKAQGQLQSITKLLAREMVKDVPNKQKIKGFVDEIEDVCWNTISALAKDIHEARALINKKK